MSLALAATQEHVDAERSPDGRVTLYLYDPERTEAVLGEMSAEEHARFTREQVKRADIAALLNVTPAVLALQRHHGAVSQSLAHLSQRHLALEAAHLEMLRAVASGTGADLAAVFARVVEAAKEIANAQAKEGFFAELDAFQQREFARVAAEVQAHKEHVLTVAYREIDEELAGLRDAHATIESAIADAPRMRVVEQIATEPEADPEYANVIPIRVKERAR